MDQVHTADCIRITELREQARTAWKARWPGFCIGCDGYGEFSDGESCQCTDHGNCPRCGQPGLTSERRGGESTGDGPCRVCGWNYDDGLPAEAECFCDYERELAEFNKSPD